MGMDARRKFGAEQASVGGLVGELSDYRKPPVGLAGNEPATLPNDPPVQ